jgi:uncharacterized protein YndB with AHSA1/START domain
VSAQREPRVSVVNANAPVVSRAEGEIDAPIADVWRILTEIERWPTWNPDVKSVSIDGRVAEGARFRWKAGPSTISSTVTRVEPPQLIAWTGKTLGIRAIHVWHLEERDGRTHVRTEESYDGLVARLLRRSLQKTLDAALTDGVRYLETEAERITATPP